MTAKGVFEQSGQFGTLTFVRLYRHPIDLVWTAIATPEGLANWLMCRHAVIEGRAGGRIELVSGPPAYHSEGVILAWDPPRVFEYEWNVAPVPEMPHGQRAIFRYELTSVGESTRVVVTYSRLTKEIACGFLPGLHAFLDRLEAQLDGHELPSFFDRFAELQQEYPEWTGHATNTRQ